MNAFTLYPEASAIIQDDWFTPIPIIQDNKSLHDYPIEAFPLLARDAARAIAYHVQAPLALAGQCVLGTLAYLAQPHVNAFNPHCSEGAPSSLFILTEGESGIRKTTCQMLSDKVINDHERAVMAVYQEDIKGHELSTASLFGKYKAEYLSNNPAPESPKTIYSDATIEPIISSFIAGTRNAAFNTDEAGQFFGGHTMTGDTVNAALGMLTKIWDGGVVERTRSKGNANASGVAYDVRLTVNMLGQREVLFKALNDPVLRGQGFLPRFIFACPDSIAGTRLTSKERLDSNSFDDVMLKSFWSRCEELFAIKGDSHQLANGLSLSRRVIPLDSNAEKRWIDFYNETEREQLHQGTYEYLKAFAARAGANALRIAAIFAFFDQREVIDEEVMGWAIKIVRYSLQEWARYTDVSAVDTKLVITQRLLDWMVRQCKKNGVYQLNRREVMQSVSPKILRKKDVFHGSLELLRQHHHIKFDDKIILLNPAHLVAVQETKETRQHDG